MKFWTLEKMMSRTIHKKPWYKPPKDFKKIHRREEKAREKAALRNDREVPTFKRHDVYDYI